LRLRFAPEAIVSPRFPLLGHRPLMPMLLRCQRRHLRRHLRRTLQWRLLHARLPLLHRRAFALALLLLTSCLVPSVCDW